QSTMGREPGAITLDRGGTYTIVVGNDISTELGTYTFKLWPVPQPDRFSLTVGDSVAKDRHGTGAGYIETFGAKDIYTFTATPGQTVVFAFEGSSGNYIPWVVTDDLGAKVFDTTMGRAPGAVKLDRGGTYTITVGGDTSLELGAYGFRLGAP
ncbi:MAG TPA: hypothetical protein VLA19_30025, partial [Herpetosiphonaceae bacterium]|nr:hypothetical protein [Herpetosiphonaceae bacterium]